MQQERNSGDVARGTKHVGRDGSKYSDQEAFCQGLNNVTSRDRVFSHTRPPYTAPEVIRDRSGAHWLEGKVVCSVVPFAIVVHGLANVVVLGEIAAKIAQTTNRREVRLV